MGPEGLGRCPRIPRNTHLSHMMLLGKLSKRKRIFYGQADVRGGGKGGFDPLKRAENSVFGPENYFFCKHQIKSQKTDHKGAWGMGSTPAKNVKICQLTIVRKKA